MQRLFSIFFPKSPSIRFKKSDANNIPYIKPKLRKKKQQKTLFLFSVFVKYKINMVLRLFTHYKYDSDGVYGTPKVHFKYFVTFF